MPNPRNLPPVVMRSYDDEPSAKTFLELLKGNFGKVVLAGKIYPLDIGNKSCLLYDRICVLGDGHGGAVFYLVYQGLAIARKEIIGTKYNYDEQLRLYLREIDVIRYSIACPYVVQFFGYYVFYHFEEFNINIFMEKLPLSGSMLITRIKKLQKDEPSLRIPDFVIGRIACSVIHALRYLKEKVNIIHRDIKPSNILFDYDGRVKVCDFGICGKLVQSRAMSKVGSYPYLPPERFDEINSGYTIKSDIWALGISLIEMVHLVNPYWGEDVISELHIITAIMGKPAPRIRDGENEEVAEFVENILHKDPDQRPTLHDIQTMPFFVKHDVPFEYIGTALRPPEIPRPSVGKWIDKIMFDF